MSKDAYSTKMIQDFRAMAKQSLQTPSSKTIIPQTVWAWTRLCDIAAKHFAYDNKLSEKWPHFERIELQLEIDNRLQFHVVFR